MPGDEGPRPFYEERWFQGAAAVLTLATLVLGIVGGPKLWDVIGDTLSSELPQDNTQYVLDASAAMGVEFGADETKLSAAARTIADVVEGREGIGLALRRFGGACGEPGDLLVDFGDDRADEVAEAAGEQEAQGEPNLVNAVVAAIDDYSDVDRFPREPGYERRIVVVTGSADGCFGEDAAEQIRRRMAQTGVELDFTFVGVAVPAEERDRLRQVAQDLESPVVFAETDVELGQVVDYLELEPVVTDSQTILDVHDAVIDELIVFAQMTRAGRFDDAETALRRAEATFARTESRFEAIGARASRPEVRSLHELLGRARVIQQQMFAAGATLLAAGRKLDENGSEPEYENAVAEWTGVVRRQQDNVKKIDDAVRELEERLPILEG
jgi:hypothetical protein